MKARKAIAVLQRQINTLASETNYSDRSWIIQTRSLIAGIFGNLSDEHKFMQDFDYLDHYVEQHQWAQCFTKNKAMAVNFLQNGILTIKDKGVYRKPVFQGMTWSEIGILAAIIIPIIGGASWLSYNTGINNLTERAYNTEQANTQLTGENGRLKAQIIELNKTVESLKLQIPFGTGHNIYMPSAGDLQQFDTSNVNTGALNQGLKITK